MRTGGTFAVGLHRRGDYQSIHHTGRRGRFFYFMYTGASSRAKIVKNFVTTYSKLPLKPKCCEVVINMYIYRPQVKKRVGEVKAKVQAL